MREAIRFTYIALAILCVLICLFLWPLYGSIGIGVILFGLGLYDIFQTKHTVLRNFPIIGHIRYLLELVAPELHQYFVESNTDGKPIDRNHRSYIYARAKLENETHPFGTELDINNENFKWMQHSKTVAR
jgi:hypothetical protein